jgi:hypothetical protein
MTIALIIEQSVNALQPAASENLSTATAAAGNPQGPGGVYLSFSGPVVVAGEYTALWTGCLDLYRLFMKVRLRDAVGWLLS